MKPEQILMASLQDARESKYNALHRIMVLKNEQSICAAQWNDTTAEVFQNTINIAEKEYQQQCMLVLEYEKKLNELKKR